MIDSMNGKICPSTVRIHNWPSELFDGGIPMNGQTGSFKHWADPDPDAEVVLYRQNNIGAKKTA